MAKIIKYDPDFIRAVHLLKNKFHTVEDLVKFWSFCGPFKK